MGINILLLVTPAQPKDSFHSIHQLVVSQNLSNGFTIIGHIARYDVSWKFIKLRIAVTLSI